MSLTRKKGVKRDPRKQNPELRDALRKRVMAMSDVCHICGRPIDFTLPPTHPLSFHVDHIIPISRGGSVYDIDNLAPAHRICNMKKSNSLPSDKMPKVENPTPVSRAW